MDRQKEELWLEAQSRCRLSDEEVRMAKELGFQPESLIKNIPAPSQSWKAPVNEWVRSLYEKKIGSQPAHPAPEQTGPPTPVRPSNSRVIEFRNPANPWPDHPNIPDLPPLNLDDDVLEESQYRRPSQDEIDEQNGLLLRRQRLFRRAAQVLAVAFGELPEVEKVAAFGAAAQPLELEVPRFREFRRYHIEVLHECADLDLAVWIKDFGRLKTLKKALSRGLQTVQDTPWGGVAHHQVDVHLFDAVTGDYRGMLCIFGECPKPGKTECRVPRCGAQLFLQQFSNYRFNPGRFSGEPQVVLFDRANRFLVHMPRIEAKAREVIWSKPQDQDDPFDDDDSDAAF